MYMTNRQENDDLEIYFFIFFIMHEVKKIFQLYRSMKLKFMEYKFNIYKYTSLYRMYTRYVSITGVGK